MAALFERWRAPWGKYYFDGRRYVLNVTGARALRLFSRILNEQYRAKRPGWLLKYRTDFRGVIGGSQAPLLSYVVRHGATDEVKRLALWLRGRCGGPLGTDAVADLAVFSPPPMRKEAVRALRRMHAWEKLKIIERGEQNPRIRELASQRSSAPFESRLSSLSEKLAAVATSPLTRTMEVRAGVTIGGCRHGEKPLTRIRELLQRIRMLVTGR